MNEPEILHSLLDRLRVAVNIEQPIKSEYEKLVNNVPEHGFEQILPLDTMNDEQENAIRDLRKLGYIDTSIKYHGSDGHFYHIDLRGNEYKKLLIHETASNDDEEREIFSTGAVRDTSEGKPRFDLISPVAMEKLAKHLTEGAKKYGCRNWEKGISLNRHAQSLLRHLSKFQLSVEDGEDHLTAAFCNLMFMVHTREMVNRGALPESLLDMPNYNEIPRVHRNGDEPYEHEDN